MTKQYRLDDHDRKVIDALQALLWKVMTSNVLPPAKLVSIGKVLHALWQLPRPTNGVTVTIEISYRVHQQEGVAGGSSLTLSVEPELLNLDCGESSYEQGCGSEAWTTMSWSAEVGERTDNDGSWDEGWLGEPYYERTTSIDLADCTISVQDDDNDLLIDTGEEQEDEDMPLILCRGENISLSLKQWRAAILAFKEGGWDPGGDLDVYSTPGIAIGAEEGLAMQEAGNTLQRMIADNPELAQSIGMNMRLFLSLAEFVGKGQFSIRSFGRCLAF
jgi:hypothetical protein